MSNSVVELFAGVGGFHLAAKESGWNVIWANQWEPGVKVQHAFDCYVKNFPDTVAVNDDIANVIRDVPKHDLLVGGFPCQAFSHAGNKLGFKDTRGTLFYEFARAVKEIKPKIFLAENVEAIIRNDNGKTLTTIMNVLSSFGYDVQYKILNALNYKVPQKRKRIIFIGTKNKIRFQYPKPSNKIVTLREGLKNVPNSPGEQYSDEKKKMMSYVPPGGSWVDMPTKVQKKYMGKSFYSTGGRRGMGRRISWDEPCLTLTTSPAQKMTERCHPEELRPFTIREYARIQTFPDSWKFIGSNSSQYRQIGNAIPVKFATALATSLYVSLISPELVAKIPMQKKIKDYDS